MTGKLEIAKLALVHDFTAFECGNEALNRFIKLYALQGQRAGISQTYVATDGSEIAGYHTIVVGQVTHDDAPERLTKAFPGIPSRSSYSRASRLTKISRARALARRWLPTPCAACCRLPILPAFAPWWFTPRTNGRSVFMRIWALSRFQKSP